MRAIVTFCAGMSAIVISCGPAPRLAAPEVPPPNPEIPATAGDVQVCAHLAQLGCREAWPNGGACVELMTQAHTDMIPVPTLCLANATTQAMVRACGGPDTLTFRCGGP